MKAFLLIWEDRCYNFLNTKTFTRLLQSCAGIENLKVWQAVHWNRAAKSTLVTPRETQCSSDIKKENQVLLTFVVKRSTQYHCWWTQDKPKVLQKHFGFSNLAEFAMFLYELWIVFQHSFAGFILSLKLSELIWSLFTIYRVVPIVLRIVIYSKSYTTFQIVASNLPHGQFCMYTLHSAVSAKIYCNVYKSQRKIYVMYIPGATVFQRRGKWEAVWKKLHHGFTQ